MRRPGFALNIVLVIDTLVLLLKSIDCWCFTNVHVFVFTDDKSLVCGFNISLIVDLPEYREDRERAVP